MCGPIGSNISATRKWCLESLTATGESLEQQFLESWKLLGARGPDGNIAFKQASGFKSCAASKASGCENCHPQPRSWKRPKQNGMRATKRFATSFERKNRISVRVQLPTTKGIEWSWVIEEARSMETGMSQQRKKAENNTKGNTKESKKRRRDVEEEISLESQSKRAKGRIGSENAASGATKRQASYSKRASECSPY